ncbi:macoilin isoform X2 [Clupea harengus]|uniref:Macoilin isoform X2 n=1 Tax=Clupea harengus TaxID=7950 RepID=A0A6P8GCJ6_CLUHA|nr:macoilin isoform X2 [Clupea harengus]
MKKRCADATKLRKMKKLKMTERISESAYTVLKFMIVWTLVLLADFLLEFRLEYLWPCWLFFGSVYTTFHCHGLVICVVFVCAAFTLDVFCFIFVPLHWLFLAASTYVLFNYIWHTEKGICMSTASLWILLVYTEASLRLKDQKNSHANLSHIFAAHCIGYPVVYLGFDVTCYFTGIFKLRTQKTVQNNNDFHMHLLEESLPPPGLLLYPKCASETRENVKWRPKVESVQYQCQTEAPASDESLTGDYLQIPQGEGRTEGNPEEVHPRDLNSVPTGVKSRGNDTRDPCHPSDSREPRNSLSGGAPAPEPSGPSQRLPQEEHGPKTTSKASKSSPPKAHKAPVTVAPSGGKTEKRQKNAAKTVSPNRDSAEKGNTTPTAPPNHHAEQITKLEQELRRLKGELQASQQTEQELRSHVCNLTNSERSLRPEVSVLRHTNELLQSKILCLTKTKQRDKQTSAVLEKKARAETEARVTLEKQLAELQAQKLDEAAILLRGAPNRQEQTETLMLRKKVKDLEAEYKQLQMECQGKEGQVLALEKEVESLQKYRSVETEMDTLLSALSSLQDKAQHLEYNLSAETRIKLDLFSALGDARRQLEIAQGKLRKQDQEIREMKQRIAEVMAVSPAVSYVAPRPAVPQYFTKFLNSERYVLNPRALMYQCLKK